MMPHLGRMLMEEGQYFHKALSKFTLEFAAGDAIRILADKGLTVEEIYERLSFPVPRKTIGELVWNHYLDVAVICLSNPSLQDEKVVTTYEKVQGAYGRISFRQIRRIEHVTGEYVPCDFGKRLYADREQFLKSLQCLSQRDRDYVLGLPWPLGIVYHKKDERMARIQSALSVPSS